MYNLLILLFVYFVMEHVESKIHPISKLDIYTQAKRIIFQQMDNDNITPERADVILGYVKQHVVLLQTAEESRTFYQDIGKKFRELRPLEQKFRIAEEDGIEHLITLVIDQFMEEGNIDLAAEIMRQHKDDDNQNTINKLEKDFPIQFSKALKLLEK